MTGVLANDEDLAMAPNDFALIAHLLDRRTYFHCPFLSVTSNTVYSRPAADVDAINLNKAMRSLTSCATQWYARRKPEQKP